MVFETLTGALPKSKDSLRNKSLNNLRILVINNNQKKQNTLAELEEKTFKKKQYNNHKKH